MIHLRDLLDADSEPECPWPQELAAQLWEHAWIDAAGQQWQTLCTSVTNACEFDRDVLLGASGRILRDGEDLGYFNRSITLNAQGTIEIIHDRVLVYEQGQGFGRAWTHACAEAYHQAGFEYIVVNVAQEGLLIWPKLGYDLACAGADADPADEHSRYAQAMRAWLLEWASQMDLQIADRDDWAMDEVYALAHRSGGPPNLHEFIASDLVMSSPALREVICNVDMQLTASPVHLLAHLAPKLGALDQAPQARGEMTAAPDLFDN